MAEYGLPVLFALSVWWFSTGLILYLDGLPTRTFRWSLLGATVLLKIALYGLVASSAVTTAAGAFTGFACAILVWAWLEMSFLMGFVTGPRKSPCPRHCGGWAHFVHAIQAILYHELAIIAAAIILIALTWNAPNQVGLWTFLILWGMRESAKLNMFLGVRNLSVELLPAHLRYLENYFTVKPMNLLFPISITLSTIIAALLVNSALSAEASAFDTAGLTLLGTLLLLAIIEHWLLVLPAPVTALWQWCLHSRDGRHAPGKAEKFGWLRIRTGNVINRKSLPASGGAPASVCISNSPRA